MEAGRPYQEAIEVPQGLDAGELATQWEWRIRLDHLVDLL